MKKQAGFTLIELLVVVAIIAILATTILASLGKARQKTQIARAQSEVSSMRAAAELTTGPDGGYPGTLFTDVDSGMKALVDDVSAKFDETYGPPASTTGSSSWAFSFTHSNGAGKFCADSSGFAGEKLASEVSGVWACR